MVLTIVDSCSYKRTFIFMFPIHDPLNCKLGNKYGVFSAVVYLNCINNDIYELTLFERCKILLIINFQQKWILCKILIHVWNMYPLLVMWHCRWYRFSCAMYLLYLLCSNSTYCDCMKKMFQIQSQSMPVAAYLKQIC